MKFTFSRKSVIVTPLVLLSFFLIGQSSSQDADKQLSVTDDLFKCLTETVSYTHQTLPTKA